MTGRKKDTVGPFCAADHKGIRPILANLYRFDRRKQHRLRYQGSLAGLIGEVFRRRLLSSRLGDKLPRCERARDQRGEGASGCTVRSKHVCRHQTLEKLGGFGLATFN